MIEEAPIRNLSTTEWKDLLAWTEQSVDRLEDGAIAAVDRYDPENPEIRMYASALNKPVGWNYPFLDEQEGCDRAVETIGRAYRDSSAGLVRLEVVIPAAAQAIRADYESGTADLDYVAYEQAVDRAVNGRPEDLNWLDAEYRRLLALFRKAK
jgi:hypothetical protein